MRLARATAGHVPAHARPTRTAVSARSDRRAAGTGGRLKRWTPILIIGLIYLVAIVVNEWRLHQHVQELRERPPAEVVVDSAPAVPAALAEAG